jgi:hypothetical protein
LTTSPSLSLPLTFFYILGTLGHHLSHGTPLIAAVEKAVRCASLSVTRKGAQSSYPTVQEVSALGLASYGPITTSEGGEGSEVQRPISREEIRRALSLPT